MNSWLASLKKGDSVRLVTVSVDAPRVEKYRQEKHAVVRRITPTGRIVIDTGHTFLPCGREFGASGPYLHTIERFTLGPAAAPSHEGGGS